MGVNKLKQTCDILLPNVGIQVITSIFLCSTGVFMTSVGLVGLYNYKNGGEK